MFNHLQMFTRLQTSLSRIFRQPGQEAAPQGIQSIGNLQFTTVAPREPSRARKEAAPQSIQSNGNLQFTTRGSPKTEPSRRAGIRKRRLVLSR
jgi:hypothetical protein